jgi:hypothetical protein
MDQRREQVVLETGRYRIAGALTLPSEGYRSRLSDYVNQRDREFFSLEDVTLTPLDAPDETTTLPFLMVARSHVVFVTPTGGAG